MNPIVIDVARMRQKITLEVLTTETSTVGQPIQTWTSVGSYWAEVVTTGGDLGVNADQLKAILQSKVTMRQTGVSGPTIVPGLHRFLFGSRILTITSVVALDNRNAYWEIGCVEEVS
jgi:SPP1 family predicted phage head-tail adaptor